MVRTCIQCSYTWHCLSFSSSTFSFYYYYYYYYYLSLHFFASSPVLFLLFISTVFGPCHGTDILFTTSRYGPDTVAAGAYRIEGYSVHRTVARSGCPSFCSLRYIFRHLPNSPTQTQQRNIAVHQLTGLAWYIIVSKIAKIHATEPAHPLGTTVSFPRKRPSAPLFPS